MSPRCAEIVRTRRVPHIVRSACRAVIGCALISTSALPGAAPATASSYPIVHAPRTEPLDFDYRLEGTTSLVLQVFDDGEAVHVQPAPGTPHPRLRPLSGELRLRGPYLIVTGLPARIALVDGADPSRRVDIIHRRRARGEGVSALAEEAGLITASGGPALPVPGFPAQKAGDARAASRSGTETVAPRADSQPGDGTASATAPLQARLEAVPVDAPDSMRALTDCPAVAPCAPDGEPGAVASADTPYPRRSAPAEATHRSEALADAATATGRAIPPLVFPAQASVQGTLRRWLAARGIAVEFVGVPPLRVEEAARVQRADVRQTVDEALARLGLRGEWLAPGLRVTNDRGPR